MKAWVLFGVFVLAIGVGVWLLLFKTFAALYEYWQSHRQFETLRRETASRRQQRAANPPPPKPQAPAATDDDGDFPVIPPDVLAQLESGDELPRRPGA